MKAILLSVLIVGACHDDESPAPAPATVAATPLRHAAPPPPALPPVFDLSDDWHPVIVDHDDDDVASQELVKRQTDPVGEDDRDSGDDIADIEDRCPDVPDSDDNDGCPEPAPAAAEPDESP